MRYFFEKITTKREKCSILRYVFEKITKKRPEYLKKGAKIGKNCSFTAYCEIRESVKIGDNTSFGSRCTISANALIGSDVTIKYGFVLTDTPNLKEDKIKIVKGISDGTLIGANVTLMPGFSIGKNCIIGACSQVRNNIEDNEIWYGNPAKFFKKNE